MILLGNIFFSLLAIALIWGIWRTVMDIRQTGEDDDDN